MVDRIYINEDKVKGDLIKCKECEINFTSFPDGICPLCHARLKRDKEALQQWKEILN